MNAVIKKNREIRIVCPVCKSRKEINVPDSVINQASQLTTISISEGLICNHHFQVFIDKNFKVRGYQKVDFKFKSKKGNNQESTTEIFSDLEKGDEELFENLIMEGNCLEYRPKKIRNDNEYGQDIEETPIEQKERSLEKIYEEFWEFIDDDNHLFQEFIVKDKKRRETLKSEYSL